VGVGNLTVAAAFLSKYELLIRIVSQDVVYERVALLV
jgi:hypothetical protein